MLIATWFAAVAAMVAAIAAVVALFKIRDVHLSLNSRLTELIGASHAQGRQDERDSQKENI
jgi:hypothetical protein